MADAIRTVIVDDDEEVRSLLRLRLERDGGFVVVGEGTDGGDAIELCAASQPHVVILDAAMPGTDGISVVPEIRKSAPETIVVIYTSATGLETRNQAEQVGAHAVVGKLDPFELLVGTIHRFLPEFAPVDPKLQEREAFKAKMAALLEAEQEAKRGSHWWSKGRRSRVGIIVLLVLVVLPLLAFAVWIVAHLAGLGIG